MTAMRKLVVVIAAAALAASAARGGLLEDLKAKAKAEAEKRAMEAAKKKAAELFGKDKVAEPPKEPEDAFMGEYAGTFTPAGGGAAIPAAGTVVGYLDPKANTWSWDVVLTAKVEGADKPAAEATLKGARSDDKVTLADGGWTGQIAAGKLIASAGGDKGGKFDLARSARKSPTLGARPPWGAVVLLPFEEGKPTNLEAWNNQNWVVLGDGSVLVKGGSNTTKQQFGNCKLHVEFYCPYMPQARGQGRANSGVYLIGKYEVQVLDSFGLKPQSNDCGGIYGVGTPKVNACLPPGQWQTYDIIFQAPKMGLLGQVLTKPKLVEVLLNGVKIQENVEVPGVTTAGMGTGHAPSGPLMLQDHGNPLRYRNIWLVKTKD